MRVIHALATLSLCPFVPLSLLDLTIPPHRSPRLPKSAAPILIAGSAHLAGALARQIGARPVAWPAESTFEARRAALKRVRDTRAPLIVLLDDTDERTLLAAAIAAQGGRPTIAILRDPELAEEAGLTRRLGLADVLEPVACIADALIAEARGPVAAALAGLKSGGVTLLRGHLTDSSVIHGAPLRLLGLPSGSRVARITRRSRGIVPEAGTVLRAGDELLVVANAAVAPRVRAALALPADHGHRIVLTRSGPADIRRDLAAHVRAAGLQIARAAGARSEDAVRARLIAARGGDRMHLEMDVSGARPGDDTRITATQAIARAIAARGPRNAVERVGTLVPGRLDVFRVRVGDAGRWLGWPLRDIPGIRGWTILAIEGRSAAYLPHPEDVIQPGETIVVAGPPGRARELNAALAAARPRRARSSQLAATR